MTEAKIALGKIREVMTTISLLNLKCQSDIDYSHKAIAFLCDVYRIIKEDDFSSDKGNELEYIKNKLHEKELAYDEITQALLNTEIGKANNRSNTQSPDILSHIDAIIIIQAMDQELQQYAVLDEIPFGAREPDHEVGELQRRVIELEMLLDSERSYKSNLQMACLNFCAGITGDIQRDLSGGGK